VACFFLIIAFAFLAFVVDIGRIVATRTELQNAADAAAMSGARDLRLGPASARTAAVNLAGLNQAAGDPVTIDGTLDVEIGNWDEDTATFTLFTGTDETEGNAVRVRCQRTASRGNGLTLFIAPLLGLDESDVEVIAIAKADPMVCGMIIGLDKLSMSGSSHTDSFNSDDGSYNPITAGNKGHVCSNDNIQMSGSSAIGGDAHPGVGKTVNSSSSIGVLGDIEPLTEPLTFPPVDPGDASTNNNNLSIPPSDGGNDPLGGDGKFGLSGGDHVALAPGIYYFNELTLSGGSSVTITGPTVIYVENKVNISGGSIANTSQIPANLQIYGMGGDVNISGNSDLYAAVYAPSAKVTRSGDSDFFGMVVGRELTLSGSGGIHADESLDFLLGTSNDVSLVQ
jgi:hypothetical protein